MARVRLLCGPPRSQRTHQIDDQMRGNWRRALLVDPTVEGYGAEKSTACTDLEEFSGHGSAVELAKIRVPGGSGLVERIDVIESERDELPVNQVACGAVHLRFFDVKATRSRWQYRLQESSSDRRR